MLLTRFPEVETIQHILNENLSSSTHTGSPLCVSPFPREANWGNSAETLRMQSVVTLSPSEGYCQGYLKHLVLSEPFEERLLASGLPSDTKGPGKKRLKIHESLFSRRSRTSFDFPHPRFL